ncbi:hypothetical protein CcaverHIS002_0404440 [Cutaneotrichosporon cavernicola]|nr:hypothetical protein CcaverHIS002_0404440 [Cutaneotrichosporon cavernicola]BEI99398.1 hypothetical protein CcaverHIS631_0404410 [Cutaneotrichosporon cavernicola]BEJ07175.1 hypothetical protein CcaverHIS641_0404440 [Cutaneotrichosporon cavernicola]
MESLLGGRSLPPDFEHDDKRKRRRLTDRVPLPTPANSAPSATASNTTPRTSPVVTTTALPYLPPSPPANAPSPSAPVSAPPPSNPPPPETLPLLQAVLAAGQIRLLSAADLAADNLGAYNTIREAIAAASPRPGGLEALQAVLAQGPIAGERNFAITRQALAALNLPLEPTNVTVALGLPRSEREGGSKMALPFFFASHGGLVGLFTAMRAGLGALGGLMDAAQLARTRAWLRGRSVPAPPKGGMAAYGLVLGQQAELWVMTRGPYFVARAWSGRLGTPEFAGVLANILGARERANFIAQCLQTIKEGREALASAGEQPFDTWWRGNGGDTPARTFERRLADMGFADGGARVVAWVRAQDTQTYLAPDQE